MFKPSLRTAALITMAVPVLGLSLWAGVDDPLSRQDAEQMRQKIVLIGLYALADSSQPRRTPVSEGEVNAYLMFEARDQLPDGVVEPYIAMIGAGRVSGRATVDLDVVRKKRNTGGLFDPMSYLSGRLPLSATGILRTSDGVGRFELESAQVSGVPLPKTMLQELLSYYSRSKDRPDGLSLDAPFQLPAKIREIEVGQGQAIVVQ